ncbi:MAG: helix-turn-helix domain-containing protein [Micromonosporaceae bacterium]|nr:helix-turn-helix domain-containing protein [Micromonosporaceae bacterium]
MPRYLTDPEDLKALTHPLRQRILGRLRGHGPATSADLATEFSEDRGATSYHLRQLARHGYIEVDEQRSAGRRKYWRAIPSDLRVPEPADLDDSAKTAAAEVVRQWLENDLDQVARHWKERGADPAWDAAAMISTGTHRMTREELRRFTEEYVAFAKRWIRPPEDAPPDAEPVTALFMAFRTPEDAPPPEGSR